MHGNRMYKILAVILFASQTSGLFAKEYDGVKDTMVCLECPITSNSRKVWLASTNEIEYRLCVDGNKNPVAPFSFTCQANNKLCLDGYNENFPTEYKCTDFTTTVNKVVKLVGTYSFIKKAAWRPRVRCSRPDKFKYFCTTSV
jgi:hypothetical protein